MKKWITSVIVLLFATSVVAQPTQLFTLDNGVKVIENFDSEEVGTLPNRWYNYKAKKRVIQFSQSKREKYKYEVVEEGDKKYLHYAGTKAMHLNFPLRKVKELNIHETPVLSWQWKVTDLPKGGNEKKDNANDTAASIYVVFDMGHVLWRDVPKSIRYTWSSTLPVGTTISTFFDNQKIVVVASGPEKMGRWITFEQNIVEDYKRLFGDSPPKKPLAILILSDGDSTGDRVEASYDSIKLRPKNKEQ